MPDGVGRAEEPAEQPGACYVRLHSAHWHAGSVRTFNLDAIVDCMQDTRQRIKDGLKDACGVLQVYESTCNEAVNDYADLAFNVALQVGHDALPCANGRSA